MGTRKYNNRPLELFVGKALLKSKAFCELSKTKHAHLVLFEFNARAKRGVRDPKKKKKSSNYILENNGQLKLSYSEAEAMGISRRQFAKVIKSLADTGFIDRFKRGGNLEGDYSLYGLSDRWELFGTHQFIENTIAKDTREGRGWTKFNALKI